MARTAKGRRLTERHRVDQSRIAAAIVKAVLRVFGERFDLDHIDRTGYEVAAAVAPLILGGRRQSHDFSFAYLHNFHAAEGGDPRDAPVDYDDRFTEDQATAELARTIIGVSKALAKKGKPYPENREATRQAVATKVTKVVADGGRAVIENDVRAGGKGRGPIGYARVADADPCAFCAMLASRGVYYLGNTIEGNGAGAWLYTTDSFKASNARFAGDGEFKVHDGCECTLEPVYYSGEGKIQLPGDGNRLAEQWALVAAGRGKDSFATWRRWIDSGTLPEDFDGPLEGKKRPSPKKTRAQQAKKKARQKKADADAEKITLSRDTVEKYLQVYEDRLAGIEAELAALREQGQDSTDLPVIALEGEKRRLTQQVDTYRAFLSKM